MSHCKLHRWQHCSCLRQVLLLCMTSFIWHDKFEPFEAIRNFPSFWSQSTNPMTFLPPLSILVHLRYTILFNSTSLSIKPKVKPRIYKRNHCPAVVVVVCESKTINGKRQEAQDALDKKLEIILSPNVLLLMQRFQQRNNGSMKHYTSLEDTQTNSRRCGHVESTRRRHESKRTK